MAGASVASFTDYSKTQRIVLLIDLNPFLHLSDPNPYLSALLSSSKTLLSFLSLSSSLFSFKPFFSSLSPLLSSSKLPSSFLSLSFDHPDAILQSLTQFLTSLPDKLKENSFPSNPSRASNLAASMRQLLHDYAWDPLIRDPGMLSNSDDSACIRSNLVVLFSPFCRDLSNLSDFLDVKVSDDCLRNVDAFSKKILEVFQSVNDAFVSRDIHCSWVDVKCEFGRSGEGGLDFGFFKSGIRSLGWGFCSTDSIILGSSLIPFGLIYPIIGISSNCFSFIGKTTHAQMSLEILDVGGMPLECKCSELELVDFIMCPRDLSNDVLFMTEQQRRSSVEQFCVGITKVHVKAVKRYDECDHIEGSLSDPMIVRAPIGEYGADPKDGSSEFYADKVIQILGMEMGESVLRKPVPIWQIFLSFLYREGYLALVSLSDGKSDLHTGILKPFTVSSAFLSIMHSSSYPHHEVQESGRVNLIDFPTKGDYEIGKPNGHLKHSSVYLYSQSYPSPSDKLAAIRGGPRKRDKKNLHLLHNLTWSAFCQAASEHQELDLEEVYFAGGCNVSKKLKFLKCWMKQVKKSTTCGMKLPGIPKPDKNVIKEVDQSPIELPQESEQPASLSTSLEEASSRILDEAAKDFCSGTLENFFCSLPNKIQQGLESEEVDLGAFAERIVNSSIYWLYQKHETQTSSESPTPMGKSNDACASRVAAELIELLLREPKDLAAVEKRRDPSSHASDPGSTGSDSVNLVREFELQILFRMEILQSEVGPSIEELAKQKFVKQICWLLESIQCHLDGGFFGDWRLDSYVGKIIKNRYCYTLGDVVGRVYMKMDLLLFDDEDEMPNELLNSEESDQSWRAKQENDEMDENIRSSEPVLMDQDNRSWRGVRNEEHARKLIEAQERRERARRISSFTSWMPDLQRVWAPKQPKAVKRKSNGLQKLSKRKDHKRANYDKVCETPLTELRRSYSRGSSMDDEDDQGYGARSYSPVPKALFQDNV